jgi:hypothetical protein
MLKEVKEKPRVKKKKSVEVVSIPFMTKGKGR